MKTIVAILLVCIFAFVAASDSDFATKLAKAVQAKLKTKLQKLKKAKRPAFRRCRKHKFAVRVLRTLARLGGKLRRWSRVVRRLTRAIAIHLRRKALRSRAKKFNKGTNKAKKPAKMSTKSDFFFIPAIIAAAAAAAAKAAALGAVSAGVGYGVKKAIENGQKKDSVESDMIPRFANVLKRSRASSKADFFFIPPMIAAIAAAAAKGAIGAGVGYGITKAIEAGKKKDSLESDFFPALVPAAIFAGKALAGGALGAAGAHAYDKFIRRRDMSESDAQFLGKLAGKVKGVVSKGVNIYNKAKPFIGIAKQFIDSEEESDMIMFPREKLDKLKQLIKSKIAKLKEKKAAKAEKPVPEQQQGDFAIDKCQICKAGCALIKDESKRSLCTQACETFACKKD